VNPFSISCRRCDLCFAGSNTRVTCGKSTHYFTVLHNSCRNIHCSEPIRLDSRKFRRNVKTKPDRADDRTISVFNKSHDNIQRDIIIHVVNHLLSPFVKNRNNIAPSIIDRKSANDTNLTLFTIL